MRENFRYIPTMEPAVTQTAAVALGKIKNLLQRGAFPPGSRIPGERALAEMLGVSRSTVRQVLANLESQNVLIRYPQRGWFVHEFGAISASASNLDSFTEIVKRRGFTPSSDVIIQRIRVATLQEAEGLEIPPAAPIVELLRVRKIDNIPMCLDHTILVAASCGPIVDADLTKASLYETLEELCGIVVFRSSCVLQARGATKEQADRLGLPIDAPVLECVETTSTATEVVVLRSDLVYRGDSYRFQADLYRKISN